jgi:diguanylate cyclase (GGDEF)-like protein
MVTVRTAAPSETRVGMPPGEASAPAEAVATTANTAARHTAIAEELAEAGRWEQAYQHLRSAVRLLHGQRVPDELDRLRREHAEAREQSRRDALTATYNRRYLDERLVTLLEDQSGTVGICVALVDVDHFKQVNDTYGHPFGDRVLQRLVTELDAGLPEGAFCARYGGEEFALVFPGRDLADVVRICEGARHRIDRHPWQELHRDLRVTVSIGVAHTSGPVSGLERLVGTADTLLYGAKHAGRNAVAYRDARTGTVCLAGPAAGRRSLR